MKRPFFAISALLLLLLAASCNRNKGMFILHGTVQDGTDSILVVGFDGRYVDTDTISCPDGQFTWKYRPDTVTTLILVLPDGRRHPVFAEKDVESFITIPADTGLFNVSGGYCNESYQSFYLASIADSVMEQTAARIDSFITKDPFSEVTPYLIYDCMVLKYHAKESDIESLVKRMSGNMQDAPYLVSLKADFNKSVAGNVYLDNYSVTDSTGHTRRFLEIGGTSNYLLVCVWASWMEQTGIEARDTLQYFLNKYRERNLNVMDLSIDVNADRWKETISRDTLDWLSYIDTNGWEGKLVKNAILQTVPAYVLLANTKRIMYKTTSIEELDKELDKTLPKPSPKDDKKKKNIINANTKTKPIEMKKEQK